MNDTPENPPAFPTPPIEHDHMWHNGLAGMTLRDYFAAKSLAASAKDPDTDFLYLCERAKGHYRMADAMLLARGEAEECSRKRAEMLLRLTGGIRGQEVNQDPVIRRKVEMESVLGAPYGNNKQCPHCKGMIDIGLSFCPRCDSSL